MINHFVVGRGGGGGGGRGRGGGGFGGGRGGGGRGGFDRDRGMFISRLFYAENFILNKIRGVLCLRDKLVEIFVNLFWHLIL